MNKKTLAINKKGLYNYETLDKIEAGIILSGSEVKSIKQGHINLAGSYVTITGRELWLLNSHVSQYKPGKEFEPTQKRKLLVSKKELKYLFGKSEEKGLTIIPTQVYLKNNLIKVEIAVARGKKEYDKREIKKKRDTQRELKRKFKNIKI